MYSTKGGRLRSGKDEVILLKNTIPILLYHRVDDSGEIHAISPEELERHFRFLAERGWKSLSSDEFAAVARGDARASPRSFLITFDDGFASVRTAALPLLRKYDFNALSFIATELIKPDPENTPQPGSTDAGTVENPYLSWEQLRELQASGRVDCQSHSHSHGILSKLSLVQIEKDLRTSVELLSAQLRLPLTHFNQLAWPWGLSFPAWRELATNLGFSLQYSVARQAYHPLKSSEQIPRTCFDSHSLAQFERNIWLQTGQLSSLWDTVYPQGRRVRRAWKTVRSLSIS